jgi:hypothetical protein
VLSKDEVDAFEDHDGREKWQPEDPKLVRRGRRTRCNVGGCSDIVRREPSCAAGVCSRSRFLVAALLGMTNRGNDKSWGEALSARLSGCGSRLSGYRNMLPSFARPPGRGRPGLRGLAMDCMGPSLRSGWGCLRRGGSVSARDSGRESFGLIIYAPTTLFEVIHNVLALASVALLLVAIGTLVWFFYWFFLRRLLRARRIANARFRRMMREREEQGNREGQ